MKKIFCLLFIVLSLAGCSNKTENLTNVFVVDYNEETMAPTNFVFLDNEYILLSVEEIEYCKSKFGYFNTPDEDIIGYFVNSGFEDEFVSLYPEFEYVIYESNCDYLDARTICKVDGFDNNELIKAGFKYDENQKFSDGGAFFKIANLDISFE